MSVVKVAAARLDEVVRGKAVEVAAVLREKKRERGREKTGEERAEERETKRE